MLPETRSEGMSAAWGPLRLMVALVVGVTTLTALVTFAVGEAMALGNEQHHVAAYTLGVGAITFGIAVLSALFAWGTK